MGLFGFGNKQTPEFDISGILGAISGFPGGIQDAFGVATGLAQERAPLALGARETALADLATPESTSAFFNAFAPSSGEEAIKQAGLEDIFRDIQRRTRQQFSLSGIEGSPALPETLARNQIFAAQQVIDPTLNRLQNQGIASLNARLGIDPFGGILNPLASAELQQVNLKQGLKLEAEQQRANANFARAIKESQGGGGFGRLLGAGLGALAAPFTGGFSALLPGIATGSSLGALVEGDFGLGDALGLFGGIQGFGALGGSNIGAQGASAGIGGGALGGGANLGAVQAVNPPIPQAGNLFSSPSLSGAVL